MTDNQFITNTVLHVLIYVSLGVVACTLIRALWRGRELRKLREREAWAEEQNAKARAAWKEAQKREQQAKLDADRERYAVERIKKGLDDRDVARLRLLGEDGQPYAPRRRPSITPAPAPYRSRPQERAYAPPANPGMDFGAPAPSDWTYRPDRQGLNPIVSGLGGDFAGAGATGTWDDGPRKAAESCSAWNDRSDSGTSSLSSDYSSSSDSSCSSSSSDSSSSSSSSD